MAYSEKERIEIVDTICLLIEEGESLRKAILDQPIDRQRFFEWIDKDEKKHNQYVRATTKRADAIFEEILTISDDEDGDINRDRLKVDSRKWMAGKMNPKKYGDSSLLKLGDNEGGKLDLSKYTDEELAEKIEKLAKHK